MPIIVAIGYKDSAASVVAETIELGIPSVADPELAALIVANTKLGHVLPNRFFQHATKGVASWH